MGYIEKVIFLNREVYKLCSTDIEAYVCADDGMNIYRVCYKGINVIDVDTDRYERNLSSEQSVTYGTPVLYPTPNRVRNGSFIYGGIEYNAVMHGCVKNEPFKVGSIEETEDSVSIKGILEFKKDTRLYELFPFESTLEIEISVFNSKISYTYKVINNSLKTLPYGFAIHPFFRNENGQVKIKVNAETVMDMTEEKLPTGKCTIVKETGFDLSSPKAVSELDLDHVYTKLGSPLAVMYYSGFEVSLNTTDDFSHIVVFTPKDKPFYCIENQTCSTDAHNMYDKGFKEESGLIEVKSKETSSGTIELLFKPN